MNNPLTIWLVCDGKPGHENQSLGLADAIGRFTPCAMHRVRIAAGFGPLGRIRNAISRSADFPKPDLIIGAGHATHPSLLWLGKKHRAKTIVLMRPSIPMAWFGLCIAPAHDFPAGSSQPNLILTRGAINRVTAGSQAKTGKLILIGGHSKTHGWDSGALLGMLAQATDRGGWELSDSRRTPTGFLDQARSQLPGVTCYPHQETPADWVPAKLQAAKEVWVTEDSVSMIYEALSSGARVGLLPLPRQAAKSRVLSGIDALIEDRFVTPFPEWLKSERLANPPEVLREADRCAEIVMNRLIRNGS